MPDNFPRGIFIFIYFLVASFLFCPVLFSSEPNDFVLDTSRYIPLDEIKPGAKGYCLTAYEGTKIEKFEIEVLSIVHNIEPDRDAILVMGKDERFIHTGPVAGCSGSPVYIDGRLAGALSFGWPFSKDPLYGVTPIEEMLRQAKSAEIAENRDDTGSFFAIDFSKPIDLKQIGDSLEKQLLAKLGSQRSDIQLPVVLATSGFGARTCDELKPWTDALNLYLVPSGSTVIPNDVDTETTNKLEAGGCLVLPLVTGDMDISVVGTVTDVVGDEVYGFGHSFLGYGPVDLPMATGTVHTVVSRITRSFKFASYLNIVGSITLDASRLVKGKIGQQARMIPLRITLQRYNDLQRREYNCEVANNRVLTPILVRIALAEAAYQYGDFPPEHSIRYSTNIKLKGTKSLSFENVSTDSDISDLITDGVMPLFILMDNPFKPVEIESMSFDINQDDESLASHIWSVDLSDSKLKPGQKVTVNVVIESVRSRKKKYTFELQIPKQTPPGKYDLIVCGGDDYLGLLRKVAPHRFLVEDIHSLAEALDEILNVRRDRLYCLLELPRAGLTIERAELPDLPATKALILADAKRAMQITEYQHWIEKSIPIDTIVLDGQKLQITVEEK